MKKRALICSTILLFFMMLILANVNVVEANGGYLSKIDITVPEPKIGETPADVSKVNVKGDDSVTFNNISITWYKYNNSTQQYEEMANQTEKFIKYGKYEAKFAYARPNEYLVDTTTIAVSINGNKIDATKIEQANFGSSGDTENEEDFICYEFGEAKAQKYLSKVNITVEEPIVGKTLPDASKVTVIADDNERFDVLEIRWLKYNNSTLQYELITDTTEIIQENEKYEICVLYKKPQVYDYAENAKIYLNGHLRDINNREEVNIGSSGDEIYEYDGVIYEFGLAKTMENVTEEENQLINQPTNKDLQEETTNEAKTTLKEESTSNPKTGDTIFIAVAILLISVIGLIATIVIKRKN